MSKRKWLSGMPPSIGWWNASIEKDDLVWRWWSGEYWSDYAEPCHSARAAATFASHACFVDSDEIKYTTYWPKGARVARPK